MPFTDMVVLLPGILGSVLRKGTTEVWSMGAGALFRAATSLGGSIEALTLDHDSLDDAVDDVVATRLLPDTTILPGFWKVDGYTRVATMLQSRFGLVEGQNYFGFAYDWRRDNRVAARKLSQQVPAWLALHRQRTNNPNAKVWFLGHSMGGLVARYYIEKLGGRELTRGLVTFGTPFRGSMNALDVLVNGFKKTLGPITLVDLTAMVRSLTSVYQLLPTYTCLEEGGALKHMVDLAQIPNINGERLKSARSFYAEMDDAAAIGKASGAPSYKVVPFVGFHQTTNLSARIANGGATMVTTLGGQDFQGDGTVPRLSATPDEWSNAGIERYATDRHASLQNSADVLQQLEGVLSDADVGPFRLWAEHSPEPNRFNWGVAAADRVGLSLVLEDAAACGAPLELACRPVRSTPNGPEPSPDSVDLTAYLELLASDRGQPDKQVDVVQLSLSADGWHRGSVHPAEPGAYRVTVVGGGRVTPVSDVFAAYEQPPAPTRTQPAEGFVRWSDVHLVESADKPIRSLPDTIWDLPHDAGVVLRVSDRLYALRAGELFARLQRADQGAALSEALDLHENHRSAVFDQAAGATAGRAPLRAPPPPRAQTRRGRFILAAPGKPLAIGEGRGPTGALAWSGEDRMRGDSFLTNKRSIGLGAAPAPTTERVERSPKTSVRGLLAPGEMASIDVDLVLPPEGAAGADMLAFTALTGWKDIGVVVRLIPPPELLVRPGDDVRLILVRRDAPSIPCTFPVTVASSANPGADLTVTMSFSVGGAFAGAAQAVFRVADRPAAAAPEGGDAPPAETAPASLKGAAQVTAGPAQAPVLTVLILRRNRDQPGELTWVLDTNQRVAGLPPRMTGDCSVGGQAAEYARSLAKGAAPRRADHMAFFRGVGSVLWGAAPPCFRETYKALRAALGDGFDIQIMSDDPYIPWELVWPEDVPDAGLLAVDHPVARWLVDYKTFMEKDLPRGRVLSIAPDYSRSTTVPLLPSAQLEAKLLRTQHGAAPVPATRASVLQLLGQSPSSPVAFLHFAGHGSFLGGAMGSQIYLEDDPLTSVEVRAGNNCLAEDARTLVFFNACETAAAGDSLGSVGGWAEAFVRRKYGGMIAPLWPVYDDHALRVLDEVVTAALTEKRPVAHVLRAIRKRHAAESPTYLAYVFVGDVRARFA